MPPVGGKTIQPGFARGKQANRHYGRRKCTPSAACGGASPGGGDLLYVFLRSYVAHCTVPIVPPHSGGKVVPQAPKGGKRPKAANHRNAVSADESKGIKLEPASSRNQPAAGSWKPEADCLCLYILRLPPTDGYLAANVSTSTCTARILHRMRESTKVGP